MNREKVILIIDDEESIRMSLHAYLEDCEFKTYSVSSSEDALRMIVEKAIDLSIVDLRLPGMDGEDLIRQAHQKCPKMKFIIHTGSVETKLSEDILKLPQVSRKIFIKPVFDLGQFQVEINYLTKKEGKG